MEPSVTVVYKNTLEKSVKKDSEVTNEMERRRD